MRRLFFLLLLILGFAPLCDAQNLLPQPNKKGLWGYVNEKGKFAIKPIYQAAEPFSHGLACVKINGLYGYINQSGQFVISAIYDDAESFNGEFAKCSKKRKYGLLTTSGAEYLDFDFNELKLAKNKKFYEGQKEGDSKKYVIAIRPGAPVVNAFDEVSDTFNSGYAYVKDNGVYGFIDAEGLIVKKTVYLELPVFTPDQIAITHSEKGYGLINSSLQNILPENYSFINRIEGGNYHYGNAPESFGIISSSGKILLKEGTYNHINAIDNSLFLAEDAAGKLTIINKDGIAILQNCDALTVSDNIATYTIGKEVGKVNLTNGKRAINLKGKDIWSSGKASRISYEEPFVLWVDERGHEHRMTESGNPVFEGYSQVELLTKGFYSVKKGELFAIANTFGTIITDWVDAIIPILDDYVQLVKSSGYGRNNCAIFRTTSGKMITGYDFAWVYTPNANGFIPVKLLRGDNLSRTDKMLKMSGDSFYIVGDLSEGFYPITDAKTKKMGVMTEAGKILVSPKYDEVGEFHYGMCRVWIAEKGNGFINKSGTLVVPCKYPTVLDFGTIEGVKSYTQVWDNWGQSYYIDKSGKIADPDKVLREAYDSQRQSSWY